MDVENRLSLREKREIVASIQAMPKREICDRMRNVNLGPAALTGRGTSSRLGPSSW
jgi:hypothetical protein